MTYAIELFFNKEMENKLFHYVERIAEEKISSRFLEYKARPHVALAGFNDVDEKECIEKLKEFAKKQNAIPAYIGSLGVFTDTKTIFASPIMTDELHRIHRELHECLCGFDTKGYEWYFPDRWVPHCTLALMRDEGDESFYKACDLVLREFEKVNGVFDSIGLVKITPYAEEVFVVELMGE